MSQDAPSHRQPAPGELELVRSFVNTFDVEDSTDDVATPEALAGWLAEHDLLDAGDAAGVGVGRADVRRAAEVREALRETLLGNHGDYEVDPAAARALDAAAVRAKLGVRFSPKGDARVEPAAGGVDGALGRLLTVVARAQSDGTWVRLKACPADTCRWAFWDRSRNRSAVWCNMAICGNRAKARSFRERHLH